MNARLASCLALTLACSGVAQAGAMLHVSRTRVDWGWTAPGFASDMQPVFISNIGDAPLTLTAMSLGGLFARDFQIGGTCQVGTPIAPGERCRVEAQIFFNPSLGPAWPHRATLTLQSDGTPGTAVISLEAWELSTAVPARHPNFTPDWLDFPAQAVGTSAPPQSFVIRNETTYPMNVRAVSLAGNSDFTQVNDCVGRSLFVNETCTATITFAPTVTGPRSSQLVIEFYTESYTYRSLTGIGIAGGPAAIATAVEFYHVQLDHYFVTAIGNEIAALDAGTAVQGWTRTGEAFNVWPTLAGAPAGASPVCRVYIPPSDGNSHFYSASPAECNDVRVRFPHFAFEADEVMAVRLPDLTSGACAADSVPVYRLWNNRVDTNHRYTTDPAVRRTMIDRGHLPEGYGPQGVAFCAPL